MENKPIGRFASVGFSHSTDKVGNCTKRCKCFEQNWDSIYYLKHIKYILQNLLSEFTKKRGSNFDEVRIQQTHNYINYIVAMFWNFNDWREQRLDKPDVVVAQSQEVKLANATVRNTPVYIQTHIQCRRLTCNCWMKSCSTSNTSTNECNIKHGKRSVDIDSYRSEMLRRFGEMHATEMLFSDGDYTLFGIFCSRAAAVSFETAFAADHTYKRHVCINYRIGIPSIWQYFLFWYNPAILYSKRTLGQRAEALENVRKIFEWKRHNL